MGHETSTQAPPIPERVVDASGKLLFTGADILAGQGVFQKYGLMDVGSVFGHGAYNEPDFLRGLSAQRSGSIPRPYGSVEVRKKL